MRFVGQPGQKGAFLLLALAAASCGAAQRIDRTDYEFGGGMLNLAEPAVTRAARRTEQPAVRTSKPRITKVAKRAEAEPALRSPQQPQAQPTAPAPAIAPVAQNSPSATASPKLNRAGLELRAAQRVEAALSLLGTPGLADRAFVAHVLRAAGQDVEVDKNQLYPAALYAKLIERAPPLQSDAVRPGDLVFFQNTTDGNGNGKPDDGITLVGVVERAEGSRVVFIAQRAGKVRRMAVDPAQPTVIRDASDQVVNTKLVRWPGAAGPLTTAQCLAGYMRP